MLFPERIIKAVSENLERETHQAFDVTLFAELLQLAPALRLPLNRLFAFPAVLDDLQVLILACFF